MKIIIRYQHSDYICYMVQYKKKSGKLVEVFHDYTLNRISKFTTTGKHVKRLHYEFEKRW